jgi:hypothetical protein
MAELLALVRPTIMAEVKECGNWAERDDLHPGRIQRIVK